jgi:hypothetical protein
MQESTWRRAQDTAIGPCKRPGIKHQQLSKQGSWLMLHLFNTPVKELIGFYFLHQLHVDHMPHS